MNNEYSISSKQQRRQQPKTSKKLKTKLIKILIMNTLTNVADCNRRESKKVAQIVPQDARLGSSNSKYREDYR